MSERLSHRMAVEWQNNGRRDAAKNVRIICHGADHAEYNIFVGLEASFQSKPWCMLLLASAHTQLQCKLELLDFTPRMVPLRLSVKSFIKSDTWAVHSRTITRTISFKQPEWFFACLVTRARWLATLYLAKSDGTTTYQCLRGREYHGVIS